MWRSKKGKKIVRFANDYKIITNTLLSLLYFKKIKHAASAISHKNRFLIMKRSARFQFVGLFINNGCRLRTLKLINTVYRFFLYKFHDLDIFWKYSNLIGFDKSAMGEFINLYNTYLLFKDWSRALIWRLEENLPMIKVISKKNNLKKKKKKKKKKFILEYKYIKKGARFQIALRWVALLTKINNRKLIDGLSKVFINFIIDPKQSQYVGLKRKIYSNLLTQLQ